MTDTIHDPAPDPSVTAIRDALGQYEKMHPNAQIEVYRRSAVSIGVRIIDSDFQGFDRVAREENVWPIVETLPDEVQADISHLILLTPKEAEKSFANYGGAAATNPLLEATLGYLREGKQFAKISPVRFAEEERTVTFRFSDGTVEVLAFNCDHATFMQWWKQTARFLHQATDAFREPAST